MRLMPLVVGALAVAVYLGSAGNGFTFDDPYIVVENPSARGERGLAEAFTSHDWAGQEASGSLYRPLTIASYRLNHDLAGLAPWSYHLVNVALHGLVAVLLLLLARRLVGEPAASAAAILFAVHPLHSEAVASIVGRAELLSALFVLAAWYLRERPLIAMGLFACALLSKENAVVLPGLLVAEDVMTRARRPATAGEAARRYLPSIGAVAAFMALRLQVLGPVLGSLRGPWVDQPADRRILTAVEVLGREILLLLWPATLSADYSYNQIPAVAGPLDPGFLLGLTLAGACLGLAILARRRLPGVTIGITVFFVAILPTSNLLFGIGVIMAERRLYLPSIGFCLAAGAALALAAPLAARSWDRTADWFDQRIPFEATALTSPRSGLIQVNLESLCLEEGRLAPAEAAFRRAISIAPDRPGPRYDLGRVLETRGRLDEAIAAYREAIRLDPNAPIVREALRRSRMAAGSRVRGTDRADGDAAP